MSSDTEDEYDNDSVDGYGSDIEEKKLSGRRRRMLQDTQPIGSPRGLPPVMRDGSEIGRLRENVTEASVWARRDPFAQHMQGPATTRTIGNYYIEDLLRPIDRLLDEAKNNEEHKELSDLKNKVENLLLGMHGVPAGSSDARRP